MHAAIRSTLAALVLATAAIAPAAAQGAPPAASKAQGITPEWLLAGEWRAVASDTWLDLVITEFNAEYWMTLAFRRAADGGLEAVTTARQIKDRSEVMVVRNRVEIIDGEVMIRPEEIVGKPEWAAFVPKRLQLGRVGDKLVGRMSTPAYALRGSQVIEFSRQPG